MWTIVPDCKSIILEVSKNRKKKHKLLEIQSSTKKLGGKECHGVLSQKQESN